MRNLLTIGLLLVWLGAAVQAQPTLTPEQRLRIEIENWVAEVAKRDQQILALKIELGRALEQATPALTTQAQDSFSQRLKTLKADIEATNPGYSWDLATGTFTPKPKP